MFQMHTLLPVHIIKKGCVSTSSSVQNRKVLINSILISLVEGTANFIPTMRSKLPFSIISLAISYLVLNIIVFRAATTVHGAAVKPSRNLAGSNTGGVKLRVIHVYGDPSPYKPPNKTWESLISHTFSIGTASDVPVASGNAIRRGSYIIKVDFGAPGESFYTVIDTGSDITWIPCIPCSDCDLGSNTPFNPSNSSTYRSLSCDSELCNRLHTYYNSSLCNTSIPNSTCVFKQTYGDKSGLEATLSTDTLSVGSDSILNFAFGCARQETVKEPGFAGFGRGVFSFVSQTVDLYNNTFSYCLPSLRSSQFSGSLTLGKEALSASASLAFTPLLTNPGGPSYYYIGLKGISVGADLLSDIPPNTFALNSSDGGGTIIDSGTVITRLVEPAYNALRDAFRRKLSNLSYGMSPDGLFDTCYDVSTSSSGSIDAPPVTLHFDGGMDLELMQELILFKEGSLVCLAFALPLAGLSSMSIIGNYQQQNMLVVYDAPNARIGFAVQNCSA